MIFDLKNREFLTKSIGYTKAWSWQLGSRLRWIESSNSIGFNDFIDGQACYNIRNLKNNKSSYISYPLFDLHEKKKLGISINFDTLKKFRPGYGFSSKQKSNDIKIIDLVKNKVFLSLGIESFRKILDPINPKIYYFNHLNFSKCGNFFFFLIYYFDNKVFKFLIYNFKKIFRSY